MDQILRSLHAVSRHLPPISLIDKPKPNGTVKRVAWPNYEPSPRARPGSDSVRHTRIFGGIGSSPISPWFRQPSALHIRASPAHIVGNSHRSMKKTSDTVTDNDTHMSRRRLLIDRLELNSRWSPSAPLTRPAGSSKASSGNFEEDGTIAVVEVVHVCESGR